MKIKTIFKILRSKSYAFVVIKNGQAQSEIHTKGNLPDSMLIATTLLKSYDALVKAIELKSLEVGQEKTLEAIYKTINTIQEGTVNEAK